MIYVLTTTQGRVFEFYVESCAQLYCGMYGGTIALVDKAMDENITFSNPDQLELL